MSMAYSLFVFFSTIFKLKTQWAFLTFIILPLVEFYFRKL